MRLRSHTTMFVGAVAAVTGLATPASAATAAAPTRLPASTEQIHKLTAQQARKIMAAARARGVPGRTGRRAVVRSAGAVIPDANRGHSMASDCNAFFQIYGGKGFADAVGFTSIDCKKEQSLFASATVSRDRFYGWENQARSVSLTFRGEFVSAEAVWKCKGDGTYTYRNFFEAATQYAAYSGTIQSRFNC